MFTRTHTTYSCLTAVMIAGLLLVAPEALAQQPVAPGAAAPATQAPSTAAAGPARVDSPEALSLNTAAMVMGQILTRRLEEASAGPNSMQWTYLPGRGLLYLFQVEVDLSDFSWPPAADDKPVINKEDLEWENARRELRGEEPKGVDETRRATEAIRTVAATIGEFRAKVPMPPDQQVRVALRSGTGRSGRTSSRNMFDSMTSDANVGQTRPSPYDPAANDESQPTAVVSQPRPAGTQGYVYYTTSDLKIRAKLATHRVDHRWFIVAAGGPIGGASDLIDDTQVLAHVLNKHLAAEFPNEYWGVDRYGLPGAAALVAGEWGPVLTINMTFPIDAQSTQEQPAQADEWDQTLRQLLNANRPASAMDASSLIQSLRQTLADWAWRLEGLREGQSVTLLVFGTNVTTAAGNMPGGMVDEMMGASNYGDAYGGGSDDASTWRARRPSTLSSPRQSALLPIELQQQFPRGTGSAFSAAGAASTGRRPSFILTVSAADLIAVREGDLTRDALLERIRIIPADQAATYQSETQKPIRPKRAR